MSNRYFMPVKPYSIIDQINRIAAATGSVSNAIASANADYNGHYIKWGERVVIARDTDFARILAVALAEYDRQGHPHGAAVWQARYPPAHQCHEP